MANSGEPRLEAVGISDVGLARVVNEDSYLVENTLRLLLVADGVGGHGAGDVASRTAVASIADFLFEFDPDDLPPLDEEATMSVAGDDTDDTPIDATIGDMASGARGSRDAAFAEVVRNALRNANWRIHDMNVDRGMAEGGGMGTTIVGVWLPEESARAIIFHVGDSRLYRFRNGRLFQLTRDHSLYQEWLDNGAKGSPPRKNIISRALGPWPEVAPDIGLEYLEAGDLFILCSDGMSSVISEETITQTVRRGDGRLEETCQTLIERVKEKGAPDNVTVIMARWG